MPAYRLFYFDAAEHIRQFVVLEAEDDDDAVRQADGKCDGRAMELWLGARLVRQFPADPGRAPQPSRPTA